MTITCGKKFGNQVFQIALRTKKKDPFSFHHTNTMLIQKKVLISIEKHLKSVFVWVCVCEKMFLEYLFHTFKQQSVSKMFYVGKEVGEKKTLMMWRLRERTKKTQSNGDSTFEIFVLNYNRTLWWQNMIFSLPEMEKEKKKLHKKWIIACVLCKGMERQNQNMKNRQWMVRDMISELLFLAWMV